MDSADSPEQPLEIRVDRGGETTTITLVGELDLASASTLVDAVERLRPLSGRLSIDVGGVTFIDSSGLRAILGAHHAAIEDTGSSVKLLSCTETTARLLKLSGLDDIFDVDG